MLVLRNRPKGARGAFFGFGLCVFALAPTESGYQDIASLLARQPGVTERWQKRVFAPAVRSIQVATFSFGRPIGTASINPTLQLASLDNSGIDITGALTRNPLAQPPRRYETADFPKVDRSLKGDRLAMRAPEPVTPDEPAKQDSFDDNRSVMGAKTVDALPSAQHAPLDPELDEALRAPPLAQYDASQPVQPTEDAKTDAAVIPVEPAPAKDGFSVKTASLFFGSSSLGASVETMERWQPGEEPTIVMPGLSVDPDMKATAALPKAAISPSDGGESVAGKGEVNSANQRVKTPAERMGLTEQTRGKQEKCLTEAVYFEARGEAVRGQMAVAQVVMNRVFSGFYPTTVCGVVYQNKHRRLACQFTFACDGIPDVVKEPDMWERARKIAKATLDGRIWLPEVAKSTHYHAYWVHPSWVREMKKMYKTGVHSFYRPRAWGDGSEAPTWGTAAQTAEISAKLSEIKP
ncbi:cell wall hydrolase [Tardiphaga sp. P9-11]|jgi:spore germination cell wall hydrolase CwlJ-like protein|uniref:cell wall hydrolase n=1 Tax=Tardiphaga sp. P9-11 TaxID=2024614 RepID=UPI0011F1A477|nr:cell wall hydrolase [Tardiphaga sp. P9-11]KAA0078516.1 cell wall hydrolase [Tardiphaga sp. P9-11]